MFKSNQLLQTALALSSILLLEESVAKRAPWTCLDLEMSTDPFYRMFPAFLAGAHQHDGSSMSNKNLLGRCFMNIDIYTTFTFNDAEDELKANVVFDLKEGLGWCLEHLQVSTAFSDYYNFYMMGGVKEINLKFTDPWEIADIRQSGLRFFNYCTSPFSFLESSVSSAFMWIGGQGYSKYVPMFGDMPTKYQSE